MPSAPRTDPSGPAVDPAATGPSGPPTEIEMHLGDAAAVAEPPVVTALREPADGIPDVVDSRPALDDAVAAFAAGTGPVAVDAERASGYRYGQKTYLVQMRRAGAGTVLIDPVPLPDLSEMTTALGDAEWVLHAASQDLPGLAEQGLRPASVFDTELAARLLGMERVGLAAVVAEVLGLGLAKEHSAVDWSTRPLPREWLRYAALDVEVLLELRRELGDRLREAGKEEWARQEFEAVRLAPPAAPRVEPWRRMSGLHTIRDRRRLAVARSLWQAREADARRRDISPGRVLPDAAIISAATELPRTLPQLTGLRLFSGKGTRRRADHWFAAVREGLAVEEADLPTTRGPRTDGPPPPRAWAERDPAAAARLAAARAVVGEIAVHHSLPVENLLQPDLLRRLCWNPPAELDPQSVTDALAAGGARPWQVGLVAETLAAALVTVE